MTTVINGSSGINLDFSTGGRITGDFSNATVANRALVQSSTANSSTSLTCIPNGTSQFASVALYASSSDPANTSFADLSISGSGNFARIRSYATGTGTTQPLVFYVGNSESLRLSETSKAVILAGGSTTANGTGITFPATQSASSDANTLDDYEEGTWTPVPLFSTGTVNSYTVNNAVYTKIGNMVIAQADIVINTGTGGAGAVLVSGLPFTASGADCYAGVYGRERQNYGYGLCGYVGPSSTVAVVYFYNNTFPGANGNILPVTVIYRN